MLMNAKLNRRVSKNQRQGMFVAKAPLGLCLKSRMNYFASRFGRKTSDARQEDTARNY